jgi:putative DNA methylase
MRQLLIEGGLPFQAIDDASHREKSGTGFDHPRRLHIWWARRPLAMSRAIVLGSVVPAPPAGQQRQVFTQIASASLFQDAAKPSRVDPLRELVLRAHPDSEPTVLDCFAGGGAIPLEALRLGCDVTALDLNPVAHLLERCLLEYPQTYAQGSTAFAEDVDRWARQVGDRVRARLKDIFPPHESGDRPYVWFWARTTPCSNPKCGVEIPLVRSWWLANGRRGAQVWLKPTMKGRALHLSVEHGAPLEDFDPSGGTVRSSSVTFPACGGTIAPADLRRIDKSAGFGFRLLATLSGDRSQSEYRYSDASAPDLAAALAAERFLEELEEFDIDSDVSAVPDEACDPHQGRTLRFLIYGLTHFRELFTPRQLAVAASLCHQVRIAHQEMIAAGEDPARARAIATYLGLMVSRIVDFNSAFASWGVTREMPRNTFARQSISMVWDFVEIDPFADVPGSWPAGIRASTSVINHCAQLPHAAKVVRGDAQHLPFDDETFDAVVVDPPYYDAIQYADLSDYFYVWLKRSVGHLYPELFASLSTPKAQEVIENRADKESVAYISSEEFEARLGRSIAEMRRVVKPQGVVTIVFAHTESDAWERLLRALLQAGLVVSTSWPMQSEMASRSTANISAVLGSSVVLVCRPRSVEQPGYFDEVVRELDERIAQRLVEFEKLGLSGADYLISAIGPAFEVFGRYSSVRRLNDEEVSVAELLALARRTVARHAMGRLLGSDGLAAVDDMTLLYLTWRWAYGAARIPVDEAQKLGKAFNIEVDELGGIDGLADKSRVSYGLRGPDDRKRIPLGPVPSMLDVLQLACQLHDSGRRRELAELLATTGSAEEAAFWAAARAIAESLPDGDRERTMLVNLLGGRDQVVAAAREAQPSEAMRLFDEAAR